jgi:hypothetical protein
MRKPDAASIAARKASVELVCLALGLALLVLASRIASVW